MESSCNVYIIRNLQTAGWRHIFKPNAVSENMWFKFKTYISPMLYLVQSNCIHMETLYRTSPKVVLHVKQNMLSVLYQWEKVSESMSCKDEYSKSRIKINSQYGFMLVHVSKKLVTGLCWYTWMFSRLTFLIDNVWYLTDLLM